MKCDLESKSSCLAVLHQKATNRHFIAKTNSQHTHPSSATLIFFCTLTCTSSSFYCSMRALSCTKNWLNNHCLCTVSHLTGETEKPHLAWVTTDMSVPRWWGRGRVQMKWRSEGLNTRTVPSAHEQKISSSVTKRALAALVCKVKSMKIIIWSFLFKTEMICYMLINAYANVININTTTDNHTNRTLPIVTLIISIKL